MEGVWGETDTWGRGVGRELERAVLGIPVNECQQIKRFGVSLNGRLPDINLFQGCCFFTVSHIHASSTMMGHRWFIP